MSILPTTPTLEGYIQFCRSIVGIPVAVLPDDSIQFPISYEVALEWCPVEYLTLMSPKMATLCVYNWGASVLINWAQDDPNAQPPNNRFFATARSSYGINNFVAGVIEEAHDQNTGETIAVPDSLKNLSLIDLQRLKDPYGRSALAIMQSIGTLWGLS
jgi:hypothetical protein